MSDVEQRLADLESRVKKLEGHHPVTLPNLTGYKFISPGIPPWAEKLPEPTHVGRKARYKRPATSAQFEPYNRPCEIVRHYINDDDCSGWYGEQSYTLKADNGQICPYPAKDCELIDE